MWFVQGDQQTHIEPVAISIIISRVHKNIFVSRFFGHSSADVDNFQISVAFI